MEYGLDQFKNDILDADMVLIGIGEEFELKNQLSLYDDYNECIEFLKNNDKQWMTPLVDNYYMKKYVDDWKVAYSNLGDLIKDKNYFIVTTAKNNAAFECEKFNPDKMVAPCGSFVHKQCSNGCDESLVEASQIEFSNVDLISGEIEKQLGSCPVCGSSYQFNNIFSDKYVEQGYLPQWEKYLKWMQGTLNRKLLILELGVSLACPSVIRWPFEKTAFFNQKAKFYRVNKKLYHMTEELQEKGISIQMNAVTFLKNL